MDNTVLRLARSDWECRLSCLRFWRRWCNPVDIGKLNAFIGSDPSYLLALFAHDRFNVYALVVEPPKSILQPKRSVTSYAAVQHSHGHFACRQGTHRE